MITEVSLKGWRSHWDSEFRFSGGTNALIGVMGAGKSSLLDSMSFALFGTFPALQARKLTLDNVIMNRPQQRDMAEVKISFRLDGNLYTV
ncbi:MAG: AAA family ATPase, partial [archaeon]